MTNLTIRVLYVDVYPLDRPLIRAALLQQSSGFELIEVTSRAEFDTRLAEGGFDLVLSDFNILGLTGLQVLDKVKLLDSNMPVVIITGTGSEEVAVEAMKRGAADYIVKSKESIERLPQMLKFIFEQQQLEQNRKQAEARWRYQAKVLEHVSDAIIVTDLNFTIVSWNKAAEQIYGWRADEVMSQPLVKIVPTSYPNDDRETVLAQFQKKGLWKGEVIQRRKDGLDIHILASVALIKDETGPPTGVVAVNRDITRRKRVEEALHQSEAHYRSLLESAQGFAIYRNQTAPEEELQSRVIFVSPSIREIMGVSDPYNIATWFENIHPNDLPHVLQNHMDSAQNNLPFNQQMRIYHPLKHEWCWIQAISHPVYDDRDGHTYFNGIIIDITAQKQAEAALQESERRWATLMSNLPGMAYRCRNDQNWTMELVSAGCFDLTGYRPDDLQHNNVVAYGQLIHPDDREQVWQTIQTAANTGEPFEVVYRLTAASGQEKWVWEKGRFFFVDGEDKPFLEGFVNDITERKRVEEALRRSEMRYRQLTENSHDLIWEVDTEGTITFMNAAAKEIYGYEPEEMIGWNFKQLMTPHDLEDAVRVFHEALATGRETIHYENRVLNKAGEIVILDAHAVVRRDNQGNIIGTIGTSQNITKRKLAEEALRRSQQILQLFVEYAPAAIAMFDREMRYIATSRRYLADYELGDQALVGRSYYDVFPELPDRWKESHRRCLAGAIEKADEDPLLRASGRLDWVRWEIHPWYERAGEIGGIMLFSEVITQRKEAEAVLQRYTQRLETLHQIDRAILAAQSPQVIAQAAVDHLSRLIPCERANVKLYENEYAIVLAAYSQGKTTMGQGKRVHIYVDHPILEQLRRGEIAKFADLSAIKEPSPGVQALQAEGLRTYLTTPLLTQNELIGMLSLGSTQANAFTAEDQEIVMEVATQLAVALQQAKLLEAEQAQRQLAEALSQTARILNSSLEVEQVLDNILANARRVVPHDAGDILLVDEEGIVTIARQQEYDKFGQAGWAAQRYFPLNEYPVLQAIARSQKAQAIPDTYTNPEWVIVPQTNWIRSYVCAPIFVANQLAGFISLSRTTPGFYDATHAEHLQSFAEQAGFALHNARLYEAEREQYLLAETLRQVTLAITSHTGFDAVLDEILNQVMRIVPYDAANIALLEGDELLIVGSQGYDRFGEKADVVNLKQTLADLPGHKQPLQTGQPRIVNDTCQDPNWVTYSETAWIRSHLLLPIALQGQILGELRLDSGTPNNFSPEDANRLRLLTQTIAIAVDNARLFEQIQRHTDELEQRVAERTAELKEQYQQQAAQEERQRLARDLHDAVSQTLFSATLLAEAIPHLWKRNPAQARQSLGELHRLNRGALAEMRNLLLELRPAALVEMGLKDLLQQLTYALLGRTRLVAAVEVKGNYTPASEVRIAFYRIAQEALNNIAKHARAGQVSITLLSWPEQLTLTIVDDGRGFNPQQLKAGHFGLKIMHERAEAIEANLAIHSEPGRGTEIVVTWSEK